MGLYTITSRATGVVLTGRGSSSNIFNVDHVNHVTHTAAPFLNSWEATVAQMNLETNPGPGDVFSPAAALSDELERLRYVLSDIKAFISSGNFPLWYKSVTGFSEFVSSPVIAARMEQTIAQPIPISIESPLLFDTVVYDTGTMTGSTFELVAPANGAYLVGGCVGFGNQTTTGPDGVCRLRLLQDDTTPIGSDEIFTPSGTPVPKQLSVETVARFVAGQKLSLRVLQSSAQTFLTNPSATYHPALWMALIGRLS